MSRLLRATVVVTYVAEAEDYGTPSAHGMCQLDVENIDDDHRNLLALMERAEDIEIYVEPVVTT
jgi:hypothetical protein